MKGFAIDITTLSRTTRRLRENDNNVFLALNTEEKVISFIVDAVVKKDLDEAIYNHINARHIEMLTPTALDELLIDLEELAVGVFSYLTCLTGYDFDPCLIAGYRRTEHNTLILEVIEE